jgi:hypothetical protein
MADKLSEKDIENLLGAIRNGMPVFTVVVT